MKRKGLTRARRFALAALSGSLLLTACASVHTASEGAIGLKRRQMMSPLVSEAQLDQSAQVAYAEVLQKAKSDGGLNTDPAMTARVRAVAGRLIVPRLGARGTLPLGLALVAVAFLIFSRMTTDSTYSQVALPGLIVFGMGLGLTMPVTFNSGTRGVDAKRTGLASAILSAAQQIGGSFGVALMTSYATQHAQDYVTDHAAQVRAEAMEAMMRAQALPQSPAGKQIIETLKAQLVDRAQIEAYSGGFSMMAWILAGAATVLVACGIGLSLRRRRRR